MSKVKTVSFSFCCFLVFLKQVMLSHNCHFPASIIFFPWCLPNWWIEVSLYINAKTIYGTKHYHPSVMLTALTKHKTSYLVFNSGSMFASPIRGGMFPSSRTVHRLKKRSRYLSWNSQYNTNVFMNFELPVKNAPLNSMTKPYKLFCKAKVKLSLCMGWWLGFGCLWHVIFLFRLLFSF